VRTDVSELGEVYAGTLPFSSESAEAPEDGGPSFFFRLTIQTLMVFSPRSCCLRSFATWFIWEGDSTDSSVA